jgi:hypothetical protein
MSRNWARSRQKVVATFDRALRAVPREVQQILTSDEWEQLFHWWRIRCRDRALEANRALCLKSVEHLWTLEQALWVADTETLDFIGIRSQLGKIEDLLQYLEKRHKRLKRKSSQAPLKD